MKQLLALISLCSLSTSALAMFCPTNFNQINIGDTIEQVVSQCGKPDLEKITKDDDNGPQEWNFYVHPQMKRYVQTRTNSGQEASVKMAIALNNGVVLNITVNGMSLASTTICGPTVSVGDTAKSVKAACGDPVFINKSSQTDNQKPNEITEYKYGSTSLIFENGKLQERK